MIRILFVIFLFPSLSLLAQARKDFTFLMAGLPEINDERDMAIDSLYPIWGICFKQVAGCMVSDELYDSIINHNNTTTNELIEIHGPCWYELYEEDIDSIIAFARSKERTTNYTIRFENDILIKRVTTNTERSKLCVDYFKPEDLAEDHRARFLPLFIDIRNSHDTNSYIIYRGFDNEFQLIFENKAKPVSYCITARNCEIFLNSEASAISNDFFLVSTQKERVGIDITAGPFLQQYQFKTVLLSNPKIYLNGYTSSISTSNLNEHSNTLTMKYPDPISLEKSFEITSWSLSTANGKAEGDGNILSFDAVKLISALPAGAQFSLQCVCKSDGWEARKVADFVVR